MQFSRFWLDNNPAFQLYTSLGAEIFPVFKVKFGGGKRTRTADICLAKAALYQLSYTPKLYFGFWIYDFGLIN